MEGEYLSEICRQNYIFNHDFSLPDSIRDFPAGWKKARMGRGSLVEYELYREGTVIRIFNPGMQTTTIAQQAIYPIPVSEGQVWNLGVAMETDKQAVLIIRLFFSGRNELRFSSRMETQVEPGTELYNQAVYIPAGMEKAYLEIGLKGPGCLWIRDTAFCRLYPVPYLDSDARGRLHIASVDIIGKIEHPVVCHHQTRTRDYYEDLQATLERRYSKPQDVLDLRTYSFCVLNLGAKSALTAMQSSPDGIHWFNEPGKEYLLEAEQMKAMATNYFLKYIRVAFRSEEPVGTLLRIFFQGQG